MRELPQRRVDALGIGTNFHHAGEIGSKSLILLHGMSTSGDSFRELMYGLSDDHYLVAPDIPGFGLSDNTEPYSLDHLVEWLASFIDQLDLNPVYLLGHSFGGILASAYTLSYPEDIRKLILLSPALLVGQMIPPFARRMGESRVVTGAGVALSRLMLERQIRIQFHEPDRMDASIWDRRRADYSRARASAAAVSAVASVDLTPRLAEINKPTLVVWGSDDPVLAVSHAHQLEEFIGGVQIQLIDNCGHVPMIEKKDEMVRISREFMR
jgi:pimeloyl-ACP methyl ester carboxylesterase